MVSEIAGDHAALHDGYLDFAGAPGAPMSRAQVVERIITINPTASVEFLARFADRELKGYLDHLNAVQEPRGRSSARWVRPADSPAIVTWAPQD